MPRILNSRSESGNPIIASVLRKLSAKPMARSVALSLPKRSALHWRRLLA